MAPRRVALALVVLFAAGLTAALRSHASDAPGRVRFPADVPPRNDVRVDNRVPVRMRDGVTLFADVYRSRSSIATRTRARRSGRRTSCASRSRPSTTMRSGLLTSCCR